MMPGLTFAFASSPPVHQLVGHTQSRAASGGLIADCSFCFSDRVCKELWVCADGKAEKFYGDGACLSPSCPFVGRTSSQGIAADLELHLRPQSTSTRRSSSAGTRRCARRRRRRRGGLRWMSRLECTSSFSSPRERSPWTDHSSSRPRRLGYRRRAARLRPVGRRSHRAAER